MAAFRDTAPAEDRSNSRNFESIDGDLTGEGLIVLGGGRAGAGGSIACVIARVSEVYG